MITPSYRRRHGSDRVRVDHSPRLLRVEPLEQRCMLSAGHSDAGHSVGPPTIEEGDSQTVIGPHDTGTANDPENEHFFAKTGDAHHFAWQDQDLSTPDVIDIYYDFRDLGGRRGDNKITPGQRDMTRLALDKWEEATVGKIQFTKNTSAPAADIIIIGTGDLRALGRFRSGPGGILGLGGGVYTHNTDHTITGGIAWMDFKDKWDETLGSHDLANNEFSYFAVVAQEVGHALGLGHLDDIVGANIMNGSYTEASAISDYSDADDAHIQAVYGVGGPVNNQAPTANAGADQGVITGNAVQLDGSGSSDPEGDALTYSWSLNVPEGSSATLSDTTIVNPTFTTDVDGDYVATLIVNDDEFDSGPDSATIIAAAADETPPVISTVEAGSVTDTSADITWNTDEASDSVVHYGTTTATLDSTASVANMVASHLVGISGLTAETTYYYEVQSTDGSGNTATDNNGELFYSFTTSAAPTAATTVSVASVTYTTEGGKKGDKHLAVTVAIVDDLGGLPSGASVSITLSNGSSSWSGTATTGTAGSVTFTLKNAPKGTYSTVVDNVTADSLTWDGSTPTNSFTKATGKFNRANAELVADASPGSDRGGHLGVSDHHRPGHDKGPGGGGDEPDPTAIDLPTVAAHEFGHSLGLSHSTNKNCGSPGQPLMCPFYLGEAFGLHSEDISRIQALYPETGVTGAGGTWANPDITYSFTPDKASMELSFGKNSLFRTMKKAFGSEAVWQPIFADALELWAAASRADGTNVELTFKKVTDNGAPFNTEGAPQGDDGFGDIRIAAHGFDGPLGVLAHAFAPPSNGNTLAGDVHFDKQEKWRDLRGDLVASEGFTVDSGASHGRGNFTLATHRFESSEEFTPPADSQLDDSARADVVDSQPSRRSGRTAVRAARFEDRSISVAPNDLHRARHARRDAAERRFEAIEAVFESWSGGLL